ncbi:glycosyltransferase family 4 protein [Nocardioides sp. CN2-186]|uniref:glycosyltransferase family 4 protein n=1 Tax=Nocardioides tweenelious TaxID=3156607 RepID=UPI0032B51F07
MKKITILCHDISNNALGRAWVLARLSEPEYSATIVGPALSGDIWAPLADGGGSAIRMLDQGDQRRWIEAIDGDILVAVKPRRDSLTLALHASAAKPRPVVADVDDWEMAFFYDYPARMAKHLVAVSSPRNVYRTLAAQRRIPLANGITVSSTWLQRRFGGEIIPHARNADVFDPSRLDRLAARARLDVTDSDVVIMFLGTVMKHKGVDLIAEAMTRTGRSDLLLAAPFGGDSGLGRSIRTRPLPPTSIEELPSTLIAADLIVLPQRHSRSAAAQVPAKVFDALALGIPVIASDVSDLKEIVGSGGMTVPPDDVDAMADAIRRLASDAGLRRQMSASARARFLANYSEDAVRPRWLGAIERAERHASL